MMLNFIQKSVIFNIYKNKNNLFVIKIIKTIHLLLENIIIKLLLLLVIDH